MLCDAARRLPALIVTLAPESATPAQIAALAGGRGGRQPRPQRHRRGGGRAAFAAGARMVTHLFNAMSQLGNREPGLVGAALDARASRPG